MKKLLTLVVTLMCALPILEAQFELRIVERAKMAHVQMRAVDVVLPGTQGLVTDIVFGIAWENDQIQGLLVKDSPYRVVPSGSVTDQNGLKFQAFGASAIPYRSQTDWVTNEWVDIAVLEVVGMPQWSFYFEKQLGLVNKGFNETTDPNFGYELKDYTPEITAYEWEFELREFVATAHDVHTANLTWSALEHENLGQYIVERSLDAENWQAIGAVQPDAVRASYEYLDQDVANARNGVFYRLRIEDKFGGFTYSPQDFVPFQVNVKIYPNPASDGLQVDIDRKGIVKPDQLVVFDLNGKTLYNRDIAESSYREYIDFAKARLETGAYILELRSDVDVFWHEKFEIMK